jgi:hypothetical protein
MAADMVLKLFGRKLGMHSDYDCLTSETYAFYGFLSSCSLPSCHQLTVNIESGEWVAQNGDDIQIAAGNDILMQIKDIPHTRE